MQSIHKPLRILLATDLLVMTATAMIVPFYTILADRAGGDVLEAGIAASVLAFTAGVTALFAGKFSDRIKRKELILATGYLVTGIGFLLYLLVGSIWTLLGVQVLIGLAQASYASTYDVLYSRHVTDEKQASWHWSLWEASSYFSTAIGALSGGLIVYFAGLEVLFITMGVLSLLSSLYLYLMPKESLEDIETKNRH